MSMSTGGSKGKKSPMADINVTPMVDVMLVLLVIFMITAPVIKQIDALDVNLPKLQGQPAQTIVTEDARTIVIKGDGSVTKADNKGSNDAYETLTPLIAELKEYKADCDKNQKPPVVVIAGDRDAHWERIMQVWNAVKTAGISQISFQVEAGENKTPGKTADAGGADGGDPRADARR
jgi:biopolymer transport protein TolR